MNNYETVIVIDAHQPEEIIENLVDKIKKLISDNGGKILDMNRWGKRRLAYEIRKKQHGYYICFIYEIDKNDFSSIIERFFRLNEEILRYLILRLDKKLLDIKLKKKKPEKDIKKVSNKDTETENIEKEEKKVVEES